MSAKRNSQPRYHLAFDGLFRSLPGNTDPGSQAGVMCYGWVISKDRVIIARGHGAVVRGRHATSNVAEYLALIEGLDALLDMNLTDVKLKVSGDAKCVIDQMIGRAAVNAASMKPLHRRASRLAGRFSRLEWVWTPRKDNRPADSLTRRAMKQVRWNSSQLESAVREMGSQSRLFPLLDLRVLGPVGATGQAAW